MSVSKLLEKNLKISKNKTSKKAPEPRTPRTNINQTARIIGETRADKDLALLDVKLKTAEMNYEILIKNVVTREEIQHIWNKIYKSATYFGDFGQRYAPVWAAALGISEHDKIDFLQKQIDEATELFMADFTETITGEI